MSRPFFLEVLPNFSDRLLLILLWTFGYLKNTSAKSFSFTILIFLDLWKILGRGEEVRDGNRGDGGKLLSISLKDLRVNLNLL